MKTHAPQCNVEKWFRNPEYLGARECNCDSYHTFDELYDHRIALFIALCGEMERLPVWRSKLHSDGSSFTGWFILGINKEAGKQITYHLPIRVWEATDFAETLDTAPEWDGHTPTDVLARLKTL